MYIFIPCILISLFTCIFFFWHLGFNSSLQHTFPLLIIQRSSITIPFQIDSLPSIHVPTSKSIHPWHKDYVIFLDSFQESLTQNMSKSRSMFSHHLLHSPHFHEPFFLPHEIWLFDWFSQHVVFVETSCHVGSHIFTVSCLCKSDSGHSQFEGVFITQITLPSSLFSNYEL